MRRLWVLMLAFAGCARAQVPTDDVVNSCLLARPTQSTVVVEVLPTQEILTQDDYRPGYNASYYFKVKGKDVGYAEHGGQDAIIFEGKLHPLRTAAPLSAAASMPQAFSPSLADWLMVRGKEGQYLCVSFNFDGIGRSGSFQQVRAGYLLPTRLKRRRAPSAYFAVQHVQHEPATSP